MIYLVVLISLKFFKRLFIRILIYTKVINEIYLTNFDEMYFKIKTILQLIL